MIETKIKDHEHISCHMPRILMFAPAFAPFANPEAIVNNKLALAFKSAAWQVDAITRADNELSDYNYGSDWEECWQPLITDAHPVIYRASGKFGQIKDTAISAMRTNYPGVGCRWAFHAVDLALNMHQENKYDVVISRGLPDFAHLPALLFKQKAGVPWIANWNDPPLFLFPPPHNIHMSTVAKYFNDSLIRDVIHKADILTFPSLRLKNHFFKYYALTNERQGFVVPHVALPCNLRTPLKNKEFILCHAGSLFRERDPSVFFQGLALFLQKYKEAPIRFVNIGIESVEINKIVDEMGLSSRFITTGKKSYHETMAYLSKSDVLVIIEGKYTEGIFLPSKIADYVQTGKPILSISPQNSTINDIITAKGGGLVADCNSKESIAAALCELYAHWEKGSLNDKYGSHKLYNIFSPETIIGQYVNIFNQIGVSK